MLFVCTISLQRMSIFRDEQWRAVYSEVETFLRANLHSPAHQSVLDCFMESRRKDEKEDVATNGERLKRPARYSDGMW